MSVMLDDFVELRDLYGKDFKVMESEIVEYTEWLGDKMSERCNGRSPLETRRTDPGRERPSR
jgi:hypothetical protein